MKRGYLTGNGIVSSWDCISLCQSARRVWPKAQEISLIRIFYLMILPRLATHSVRKVGPSYEASPRSFFLTC